jgi:hypothetical protein
VISIDDHIYNGVAGCQTKKGGDTPKAPDAKILLTRMGDEISVTVTGILT